MASQHATRRQEPTTRASSEPRAVCRPNLSFINVKCSGTMQHSTGSSGVYIPKSFNLSLDSSRVFFKCLLRHVCSCMALDMVSSLVVTPCCLPAGIEQLASCSARVFGTSAGTVRLTDGAHLLMMCSRTSMIVLPLHCANQHTDSYISSEPLTPLL